MDLVTRELLERHAQITGESTFRLYGMDWDLLPSVYAPGLTNGAALYADWLEFRPGMRFCEVGCGSGYLSVLAALRGCTPVVALDIDARAVENTRRNALRHRVQHLVQARAGDLFAPLSAEERFDLIFWNSSFIDAEGEDGTLPRTALYDEGYSTHARFLREARSHLTRDGRLQLGFSDLGSIEQLKQVAHVTGSELRVRRAALAPSQYRDITYQLIEMVPPDLRPAASLPGASAGDSEVRP
ncbi:methyltransferase [Rubrivivax sp. RP6-9]|uniref:methyltransferase n=1 Tax=Rubrivivax sp. RP6-9 TaxID=3415750 RepID=UPI003CC5D746